MVLVFKKTGKQQENYSPNKASAASLWVSEFYNKSKETGVNFLDPVLKIKLYKSLLILDESIISLLNNLTELDPDLTLLFDCSIDVGLSRAKSRAKLDRFEDEDRQFHEHVYLFSFLFCNKSSKLFFSKKLLI